MLHLIIPGVIPMKVRGPRGSTKSRRPVGLELREVIPGLSVVLNCGDRDSTMYCRLAGSDFRG